MTSDLLDAITGIYLEAVQAVLPATVLSGSVHLVGSRLRIGDNTYDLDAQPLYALAVGKAAGEMMAVFEDIAGDRIADAIAVVKSLENSENVKARVLAGAHPVPDQRSLDAGEAVLEFARKIPNGSLVVCMISGGGSALMEALHSGVTLQDLQHVTRSLLQAGASIHELNAVRARMSAIKAGGLLSAFETVDVVNLVISDVLGDDLATIASGPTVPRQTTEQAEVILDRFDVGFNLPAVASDAPQRPPYSLVLGNLAVAVEAATLAARERGFEPVVLSSTLTGEARHVGATLAAVVADSALGNTSFRSGMCLIAGGETTVTVRGDGVGGRNTEAALAAALRLRGTPNVALGFLASDGDDAASGVAGGIVDGQTITPENRQAALQALANSDSFTFLNETGAAWGTGPTGTNVNDLIIGIIA